MRRTPLAGLAVAALLTGGPALGQTPSVMARHPATGMARVVTLPETSPAPVVKSAPAEAIDFLREHGSLFGVRDPDTELQLEAERTDRLGWRHVTYRQRVGDLPVFGAVLRVHVDEASRVRAANGVFLPRIDIDPTEVRIDRRDAADVARHAVAKTFAIRPSDLDTTARLTAYHTGVVRGVPGTVELAWEIEVSAGDVVLERVFVDAISGALLDRFREVYHLDRSVAVRTPANVV